MQSETDRSGGVGLAARAGGPFDLGAGAGRRCVRGVKFAVLAALLAAALLVASVAGASSIGVRDVAAFLFGNASDQAAAILSTVRLPRVAAAALAGCALAVAGALIQGVLNNPLASPNVIGVNSGAGLAVLAASALFPNAASLLPAAAFAGALATAFVIFALAMRQGASKLVVVLAGMALTTMFGAGMNAVLIVDPDAYVGSSGFLVGSLSGVKAAELVAPAAYIAVGIALAVAFSRWLDMLSLGDAVAHGLGVNVAASRIACLATAALLAGAAVSFAGLIGFVGLIVPHIARHFFGTRSRDVVAASALMGALFVVVCDTAARTVFAPYEIAVGIVLALIGGPFFLWLIVRKGDGMHRLLAVRGMRRRESEGHSAGKSAEAEAENAFELRGVSFSYGGALILRDLDLAVGRGKLVGIVGPNGCGKSTLLKLACGLERPQRGSVLVAGRDCASLSSRQRAACVAYVPQELPAAPMTVRELVACGRYARIKPLQGMSAEDEFAVEAALDECGVGCLAESSVAALSGGQRQRAYVAMALAQHAELLLLDEPTSALDVGAAHRVMSLVKRAAAARGASVVAVIHDLDLAFAHCDEIVVMDGGAVAFQGSAPQAASSRAISHAFDVRVSRHVGEEGESYTFRPR